MEVQKECLSNRPLVVGLVGALPQGVNNLIWGFVGFQSKVAKEIEEKWEYFFEREKRWVKLVGTRLSFLPPKCSRYDFSLYLQSIPKAHMHRRLCLAFQQLKT